MKHRLSSHAFTIVELLIVVVVIAIIATIVVVSYNGVTSRARDTQRATDLKTLSEAVRLWSANTKKTLSESNTGYASGGYGWVYSAGYPKSLETLLIEEGYIQSPIRDPVTPTGVGSYMVYQCGTNTYEKTYTFGMFGSFEDASHPSNQMDDWVAAGCRTIPAQYNMNYVKMFEL